MLLPGLVAAQAPSLEVLTTQLHDASSATERLNALLDLATYYEENGPDSAIYYGRESVAHAATMNSAEARARAWFGLGSAFEYRDNLDSAMFYYQRAQAIASEVTLPGFQPELTARFGHLYTYMDDHERALESFFSSIDWLETHEMDSGLLAANHANIGGIYYRIYMAEEALDHLGKAEQLFLAIGKPHSLGGVYAYRAGVYSMEGDFERALADLQRSTAIDRETGSHSNMAMGLTNIGLHYLTKPDFDSARHYFNLAQATVEQRYEDRSYVHLYKGLGQFCLDREDFSAGVDTYLEILNDSTVRMSEYDEMEFRQGLADAYRGAGQLDSAYAELVRFGILRDSVVGEEQMQALANLKTQYQTREQQVKIVQLEAEQALVEQGIELRNTVIFAAAAGLILLAILAFILFSRYRLKATANAEKELLLGEIHHRVKNNLQMISSLLNLQSHQLKDEQAKTAVQEGRNRVKAMGLIHLHLYQHDQFAHIHMPDYVQALCEQLERSYVAPGVQVDIATEVDALNMDVESAVPIGLVLNELVTNALKYSVPNNPEPRLQITLRKPAADHLVLLVSDNGPGLPDDFAIETASSFGLKLVRSLTRELKGELSMTSENGAQIQLIIKRFTLTQTPKK